MADLSQINSQIASNFSISGAGVMNLLGWLFFGLILIGGAGGWAWWYYNRKLFNRVTTDFEIIGTDYEPTFRDQARLVKLGKGGFQVLYLKKAKVYRIAFGGRIGKNAYYFFIGQDGYPYNCTLGTHITDSGQVPIKTTNPLMRAQYTALEKQVDELHKERPKFWDKYGNWILSLGFILIIGFFAWLIYKEMNNFWGNANSILENLSKLSDNVQKMQAASLQNPNSGAVRVG